MIERVLIALDGSLESEDIFSEAERVAGPRAVFDLLHVLELEPRDLPGLGPMTADVARIYLEQTARRFSHRTVQIHLRSGAPEAAIPKAARTLGADLIALTTHARRGLSRLFMGSVAENVIRNSPTPVLLTRPELARPLKPLQRILVPLDGTPDSKQVFRTVRPLAKDSSVEVILLQVVVDLLVADPLAGGQRRSVGELLPDPATSLRAAASRLEREGLRTRSLVVFGSAADQILEQARILDVDLIAMACAARSGLARAFRSSVAFKVLRHTDRAVLLHRITSESETTFATRELQGRGET